jgi:hypothetical protein
MKDHALTLLNTYETMIAKVIMTEQNIFAKQRDGCA